ncbi:unnamed protein product [Rotaria sordida]|nr:unnamed protein product [Rotaria sordida]
MRSSHLFMYKPIQLNKQSSTITSARTIAYSDLTDNFTFLTDLFLSARSIYFNQYFLNSNITELNLSDDNEKLSSIIFDKMFLFLYKNPYTLEKLPRLSLFETIHLLFNLSIKYGIDTLTYICLQDMCNTFNLNINNAAYLLIALHQALNGPYEKYHSNDYLIKIKNLKQNILRFIQLHSR